MNSIIKKTRTLTKLKQGKMYEFILCTSLQLERCERDPICKHYFKKYVHVYILFCIRIHPTDIAVPLFICSHLSGPFTSHTAASSRNWRAAMFKFCQFVTKFNEMIFEKRQKCRSTKKLKFF